MSPTDDRAYRAALRSLARPYILDLERRGFTFRVHEGRVQIQPRARLTDLDRWTLRQHAADVRVLIEHRGDWDDWTQAPVPPFDPSRAFATLIELDAWRARLRGGTSDVA